MAGKTKRELRNGVVATAVSMPAIGFANQKPTAVFYICHLQARQQLIC